MSHRFSGMTAGLTGLLIVLAAFAAGGVGWGGWALAGGMLFAACCACSVLAVGRKRIQGGRKTAAGAKEVQVRRVLAGSVGGEDFLFIRTRGVAAVCRGPVNSEPLQVEEIAASALRPGDLVLVEAGQVLPRGGEILEGACAIDESAVTGVLSPALREAGGPRAGVLGGTRVVSGRVVVRVHAGPDGGPAGPPGS
jgi:hypothetical protein